MNRIVIISVVIVSVISGLLLYRENKLNGLGKIPQSKKPPRMRIVYSKKQSQKDRAKVTGSFEAYMLFKKLWSKQIEAREEMIILLLDRSNHVLGYHLLSMGGITGTVMDIRLIFAIALKSLATGIIVCHNHPSGNLSASESDINVTRKMQEAGKMLDIQVLDHIIITKDYYYSLADEGMM